MPSRTPVDEQPIVDSYARLQSGRAVARELGIHENTVYAVLRRHRGACVRCSAPVAPGKKHCPSCTEWNRDRMRERRKEARHRGICVVCDRPRSPLSRNYCEEHRLADLEAGRAYNERQKLKRGTPEDGIPSNRQRERALRDRYGPDAVALWRETGGKCQLCGIQHRQRAVCLHHIDSDPTHNERSNFALLCVICHKLVHLLTEHPNLPAVLDWVKRSQAARCGDAELISAVT